MSKKSLVEQKKNHKQTNGRQRVGYVVAGQMGVATRMS